MQTYRIRLFITSILIIILCFSSCKKNTDEIPDVYVDIYLNNTDPQFTPLNAVGGWVYFTGGSRGILVYRRGADEFIAYDRHCSYQPSNTCAMVGVEATNVTAVDTCCGSKFMLYDGSVANGPATRPLKQYTTTYNGSVVHIVN